jgi:hypothetical protein
MARQVPDKIVLLSFDTRVPNIQTAEKSCSPCIKVGDEQDIGHIRHDLARKLTELTPGPKQHQDHERLSVLQHILASDIVNFSSVMTRTGLIAISLSLQQRFN